MEGWGGTFPWRWSSSWLLSRGEKKNCLGTIKIYALSIDLTEEPRAGGWPLAAGLLIVSCRFVLTPVEKAEFLLGRYGCISSVDTMGRLRKLLISPPCDLNVRLSDVVGFFIIPMASEAPGKCSTSRYFRERPNLAEVWNWEWHFPRRIDSLL